MRKSKSISIQLATEGFLDELSVGKQPYTVKSYGVSLRRFQKFLESGRAISSDSATNKLTVDHAIDFGKSLQGLAPATIRNYLAAISEFYRYLFARRLVDVDMADHQRLFSSLKQMRPRSFNLPRVPTDEMIDALIKAVSAKEDPKQKQARGDRDRAELRRFRDIALLLSLKSSGMRLGEVIGLKRSDLDYRNKSAIVTGKGRKQRIVYFDDAAWNALKEYLETRKDGSRSRSLSYLPVFARHDRRSGNQLLPLSRQSVEQLFVRLAKKSNLDPKPTPHWFRHWFATQILERTQDLAALQDMLGHESPVTTRVYAKVSTKRLRQVHRVAFGGRNANEDD